MLKFFKYCLLLLVVFVTLAALIGGGGLYYLVAVVPCPEIEESHINEILGRESPVFYRDGQAKIGVLFEGIHRQYLKYEDLPQGFINALIAAEDDSYFSHFGVDIPGIIRAMLVNIQAGRIVQGGSTITQQTAKNLFKRESRSIEAKIKELLFALRLEHRYSKEKILEFYSNQFFVSGNGHGLGVAARFFFDKEPKDLSPLECAFIAGSVKRPNYYNPFLKKNMANADEVRLRGEERVRYVLGKMRKANMIDEAQYGQLKATALVFKQGRTSYAQNTVMDLVKDGLETPFIVDVLEDNGISNISTSGAHIITSLDKNLQDRTLRSLRRQLSQLDVRLRGYKRDEIQKEYQGLDYWGDDDILPGNFLFGTVTSVGGSRDQGAVVQVALQEGRVQGQLAGEGFARLADAYAKFSRNAGKASPADRQALAKQLQVGDRIYVSVRALDAEGGVALDLEKYPQVEGAAYVLQDGAVRAMGGGMSNINYNRATSAKRLMGSTFKVFIFAAALQLGWSPVDMLSNSGQTFMFQRRPYTPQGDHHSPFGRVSLSWAGVTSENIAAVWLLYHLTDHLSTAQVKELASRVDMAPRSGDGEQESYQHFKQRMRDQYGIVVTRDSLDKATFGVAIQALKPDLVFDGREEEFTRLEQMNYYEFQQLRGLLPRLAEFRQAPLQQPAQLDADTAFEEPTSAPQAAGARLVRDGAGRFIFTLRSDLPGDWTPLTSQEIADALTAIDASRYNAFWREQVLLEGQVSASTLEQLLVQLQQESGKVDADKLYTLEVLAEVPDFRIMLGMQYMVRLAKACGIDSNFEPVLSMPLGANVVSLSEMTRLYETMVTGNRHDAADGPTLAAAQLDGRVDADAASIIERIETPDGRIVYERQTAKNRVIDTKISAAICNILQNVIPYGTGHYAGEHVHLRSDDPQRQKMLSSLRQAYPLMGKTGTANDYRNAAFLGYVPVVATNQTGLSLEGGYTVGVYTGFDANMPMVKGGFRVSGALGALPAWSEIAQGILDVEQVADRIDAADLSFDGLSLQYPDVGQVFVPVEPSQGGAVVSGAGVLRQALPPNRPASLSFGAVNANGRFEPQRFFLPFWKNQQSGQ